MTKEKYTTKSGKQQWRPVMSEKSAYRHLDESEGFCLACGAFGQAAEPDATRYICESCGEPKVYGLSELFMMGLAKIKP
jgi:hypothetical protein